MTNLIDGRRVAEILAVSKAQVMRLAASGELPSYVIGTRSVRFLVEDIQSYVKAQRRAS